MIYTDGAYWMEKRKGTAAAIITRGGQVVARDADWCPAASSWDSELTALLLALEWISSHYDMINKKDVRILVDNKGVIQSFLQMDARSSQMTALRINLILADILSRDNDFRIFFSHCPSHSGVPFNEEADRMVNAFIIHEHAPRITLRQHFIDRGVQLADDDWRNSSRLSKYRGRGWMKIRRKGKAFLPQVRNKDARNFFLDLADNDMYQTSRITRAITGHAPIGEYYFDRPDRFPNFPYHCGHCHDPGGVIQTRQHIFTTCSRYQKHFPSLRHPKKAKNNDELFISFLHDNPSSFTFRDLPPDVH